MLQGSPPEIDAAVRACAAVGKERYISAAGCEIPKFTPEENLMQVKKTLEAL
jgi:uroporphyrinogen decarboxylase